MGLQSPCSAATTITTLYAVGIRIVQLEEGWFIQSRQDAFGPYASPEAALEASNRWLAEHQASRLVHPATASQRDHQYYAQPIQDDTSASS